EQEPQRHDAERIGKTDGVVVRPTDAKHSRHDVCEQWRVEEGGCHHVLQAADNIAGFLQGLFEGAAFDLALDRSLNIEVAVEKAEKVQREEQFAIAIDDDTRSQPEQRPVQVDAVQAGRNDGDVKAGQGYYGVA